VETQFKPGVSGNWNGRPQGDRRVRGIILEALNLSRRKAVEAMQRRLESVKYVQDVLELLAKLEGEMSKDAADNPNRISVILLNNQGDQPLDPETFRRGISPPDSLE
jgi:hypothetical protein